MTTVHNYDSLVKYAIFSNLAYNNTQDANFLKTMGIIDAVFFQTHSPDAQAWCFKLNNELVVSYRGTDSVHDIMASVKLALVPYALVPYGTCHEQSNLGHVHLGYLEYSYALQREVHNYIRSMKTSHQFPLISFVGHSMGGSVSFLALDYVISQGESNVQVFTYGSPPMADHVFCLNFEKCVPKSYRIVNQYDIVPNLPFPFHRHTHNKILIPSKLLGQDIKTNIIKSHSISAYVSGIRRLQKTNTRLQMQQTITSSICFRS